jgi:hypothetical protein
VSWIIIFYKCSLFNWEVLNLSFLWFKIFKFVWNKITKLVNKINENSYFFDLLFSSIHRDVLFILIIALNKIEYVLKDILLKM